MKKTVKIEVLPLEKVGFLKDIKIPEGTTKEDYSFVSIQIGKKKDMTLVGARFDKISEDELTAIIFKGITECLYDKAHPQDNKVVVDGSEVELKQVIQ